MQNKPSEKKAPLKHIENTIYDTRKREDIIIYFFQLMFNKIPATWIKAIKPGLFASWTGLITELVTKHLIDSIIGTQVQQRSTRNYIQST